MARVHANQPPQGAYAIYPHPQQPGYVVIWLWDNVRQIEDGLYQYDEYTVVEREYPGLETDVSGNPAKWLASAKSKDVAYQAEMETEQRLGPKLDSVLSVAAISFVAMAQAGALDDVILTEHAELFLLWEAEGSYKQGDIRRYTEDGSLYRCLQDHQGQADWTPPAATSLWVKIGDPAEEWPEWAQPIGSHDAYAAGAKVSHNGKHWISDVDGNVWQPGVHGWTEVEAA